MTTSLPQQIAKHLREFYFGGNWSVSNLKTHLSDVTWQQATTKVYDFNTIATLTFHINYYISAVRKVLEDKELDSSDKLSFNHPPIKNQSDWEQLLTTTWADVEILITLIEQLPEEKLLQVFRSEKYGNYYRNLAGIIEHGHYHLGQIVLIKKLVQIKSRQIENANISDLAEIFQLYKFATDFQKSKREVVVWPDFNQDMVNAEIRENRKWKLIIDGEIACVWATTFSDPKIWEERNTDPAVYIHRIATNPEFRGNNFVKVITDWAKNYAIKNRKQFVRLDTIGENIGLIEHYKKAGFNYLGLFDLKDRAGLPKHYQTGLACLFELEVDGGGR